MRRAGLASTFRLGCVDRFGWVRGGKGRDPNGTSRGGRGTTLSIPADFRSRVFAHPTSTPYHAHLGMEYMRMKLPLQPSELERGLDHLVLAVLLAVAVFVFYFIRDRNRKRRDH